MILDVWSMTPKHIDIRLPQTSVKGFLSLLPPHISELEPIMTNLRAAVDYTYPTEETVLPSVEQLSSMTTSEVSRRQAEDIHALNDLFFSNYQSYSTITQWMYLLESLRPELVQIVKIGKTHEGKDIQGIIIKGNKEPSSTRFEVQDGHFTTQPQEKAILMHGAQHAREWISVSTVCYIAYQLIAGYYIDDTVRELVDEYEWQYLPFKVSLI
jgi:extracellular matrix protein 14